MIVGVSLEPDTLAKERFQPLRCLGQGGTGMVYEALDREQNARVALKLLHAVSPDALLRFKNEFRSMRGLSHPNLVTLGELIEDSGRWFFTMEYVPGADLLSWVRRGRKTMQADPPTVELRRPSENGAKTPQPRPMRLRFDGARLRSAFAQVVAGLCALHAAGKVHRDIKPSNILVTETGRVVILDFGLVIDVVRPAHVTREDHIVGTAHYMSPEQASAKTIGPATDWYAAGVILYQALTGRLPFSGSDIDVLGAKRRNDPLPPRSVTPDVPEDLDELCCALLARDPLLRPGDAEMLERFSPGKREPTPQPPSVVPAAPFVGRARELAELRAAFAETRYGSAVTVYLIGESGIGKSALARELSDLLAREQGALCLSGACYDRESVPYKAVDGLIDSLSRHLCELERAQVNELLPPLAALLPRVFPVLRRVEAIAQAPMPTTHGYLEPKELRAQAFGALRELLRRIALRRPLVLAIDDLQWTDSDSLALLGELLRPPGEPNVLFIGTLREAPEDGPLETAPLKPSERRHIRLERLPPSDARMLTQLLIGRVAPARPVNVEAITREGAGHPLFLDELVRHFTADSTPEVRPVKLEDALWSRVEKLDPGARRIVELVSMAGGRLQQETVTQAAQMDYADFSRQVAALRAANLVRTTAARRSDTIEPFHDRVRAAVLANLDEEDRRERHERLALALEASGDAEARVVHWRGAGRPERAAGAAIEAAAAAEQALAFDRAARLYRLVLELGMPVGADPHAITVRLGDALANAGRGQSAAQIYLRAAEDATPAEAHELRHRAGVELMASGRIDQALEVFQQLMDASGIKLARSSRGALLGAAFRIVQLRLRGIGFKERASSQIPASDLQRIDLGYRLASGLAVDPVRGVHVQARHLLHALRAGDPQRIALALSGEALSLSSPNWQPKRVSRARRSAPDRRAPPRSAENLRHRRSRCRRRHLSARALEARARAVRAGGIPVARELSRRRLGTRQRAGVLLPEPVSVGRPRRAGAPAARCAARGAGAGQPVRTGAAARRHAHHRRAGQRRSGSCARSLGRSAPALVVQGHARDALLEPARRDPDRSLHRPARAGARARAHQPARARSRRHDAGPALSRAPARCARAHRAGRGHRRRGRFPRAPRPGEAERARAGAREVAVGARSRPVDPRRDRARPRPPRRGAGLLLRRDGQLRARRHDPAGDRGAVPPGRARGGRDRPARARRRRGVDAGAEHPRSPADARHARSRAVSASTTPYPSLLSLSLSLIPYPFLLKSHERSLSTHLNARFAASEALFSGEGEGISERESREG